MNFAFPLALLMLPLPLLMRLVPPGRSNSGLWVPAHIFQGITPAEPLGDRLGSALCLMGWFALCLAMTGPRINIQSDIISTSGRDIVLAMDLSGSMKKEDFVLNGAPVSRLQAVKRTASDFVEARRGDRMGLVIFGERAYFAQPLTFDVDAVARAIEETRIGISGHSTALSDGMGLAMKRLAISDAATRVVVILSDGIDTSGTVNAIDAARLAKEMGIRIHTIALGPQDLESNPAAHDAVDAHTLREMASASGGESYRVRNMQDLRAMAESLDRLEPNPRLRPPLQLWQPLWHWPATLALIILLLITVRQRT